MRQRVLITRDESRSAAIVSELLSHGVLVTCAAVTRTDYVTPDLKANRLSDYDWIAFTSGNAVQGFAAALRSAALVIPDQCRLAAVGAATASILTRVFARPADLLPEVSTGRGLADALVAEARQTGGDSKLNGIHVLHPCAEETFPDFKANCESHGIAVTPCVVYRTVPLDPQDIYSIVAQSGPCDAVVFYAPSAVRAFAAARRLPYSFQIIAAGLTTANELTEIGASGVWVAASPEPGDVAREILRALAVRKSRGDEKTGNRHAEQQGR